MALRKRETVTKVAPHYVLCRKTGKEILVTSENAAEYRNAVNYIRLSKPVPANTSSPIKQDVSSDAPAEKPPAKKAPAKKAPAKKAAAKKAPVKKAAAKKASAKKATKK